MTCGDGGVVSEMLLGKKERVALRRRKGSFLNGWMDDRQDLLSLFLLN